MNLNSVSPTVTAGTKDKYDTKIRSGVLVHVTDKIIFIEYHCVKSVQIGVISGLYFLVFGLHTEKYGTEITQYLETLHAVRFPLTFSHLQGI